MWVGHVTTGPMTFITPLILFTVVSGSATISAFLKKHQALFMTFVFLRISASLTNLIAARVFTIYFIYDFKFFRLCSECIPETSTFSYSSSRAVLQFISSSLITSVTIYTHDQTIINTALFVLAPACEYILTTLEHMVGNDCQLVQTVFLITE